MAFQQVPKTASFAVQMDRGSDWKSVNVFYVRNNGIVWDAANLATMITTIRTWWTTNMASLVSTALSLAKITGRDLDNQFGAVAEQLFTDPGTRVGDPPASIAAMVVKLQGTTGGAPRSGRVFATVGVETDQGGDAYSLVLQGLVEDAYTALIAAINGAIVGNAQVLVSRFLNLAVRTPAVTNPVTDVLTRPVVGSQRRRRRPVSAYTS